MNRRVMAARAQIKRRTSRARPLSASTTCSSPLAGARIEQSIPFEVIGELSDEAIEALARLLLTIADYEGSVPISEKPDRASDNERPVLEPLR